MMMTGTSAACNCDARKHYIPLESNPEVFTDLIHTLGVSDSLSFQDIYSLDEPDFSSMVSKPVLGLVLIFPAMEGYAKILEEDKDARPSSYIYAGAGEDEPVVWFKQTIGNACGLYALLHCICNGPARQYLKPNSTISNLLQECVPLDPLARALALEASQEVEYAHSHAGRSGDTVAPPAEDTVEHHYVAFVTSRSRTTNGAEASEVTVYEMDGMKQGPLDTGLRLKEGDDLLSEAGVTLVKAFIEREQGQSIGFSLMALVKTDCEESEH